MSLDNVFKALSIVDLLSEEDFNDFKRHLKIVEDKFTKTSSEVKPEFIPPPPLPPVNKPCTCGKFFNLIPTLPSKCKCRGVE